MRQMLVEIRYLENSARVLQSRLDIVTAALSETLTAISTLEGTKGKPSRYRPRRIPIICHRERRRSIRRRLHQQRTERETEGRSARPSHRSSDKSKSHPPRGPTLTYPERRPARHIRADRQKENRRRTRSSSLHRNQWHWQDNEYSKTRPRPSEKGPNRTSCRQRYIPPGFD